MNLDKCVLMMWAENVGQRTLYALIGQIAGHNAGVDL